MGRAVSEYEVEDKFIDKLESIGYSYVELRNYADVLDNFRQKLCEFNKDKLTEAKGEAALSDSEFDRVLIHIENKSVYESAKIMRDKYVLSLDNGKTVYLDFFSFDTDRNIYQVSHQITMDKDHKDDVDYKNRYDVTVFINGLPLIQIELKRPGVEINQAISQINRYRRFSFRGLFRYIQIFVVSNSVQTKYFCNENEMFNGKYNPILKSLVFFWTDENNRRINTLDEFTGDFFRKPVITEIIDKYMVIKTKEPVLMVMRPYQIFADKAAKKRVVESNQNGYVFACTGSGKTLTSFKLAQLLQAERSIDKVIFLVDRKDLDEQTVTEYNSFEKDAVDMTESTSSLVRQLQETDRKLLVTTIQKMANAVKSKRYEKQMDVYRDKRVVFIIDECHRSQFGRMRADIEKHFPRANYIGFTGTPIFPENKAPGGRTTADMFNAGKLDPCLHKYLIKDAIADGNVLRFSVEYQRTIFAKQAAMRGIDLELLDDPDYCKRHNIDIDNLYHDDERIQMVAEHIFEHHSQHTRPQGSEIYTALFAVDTIKTLGKYYDAFKNLNDKRPEDKRYKVAAIFTFGANEDMDGVEDEHSIMLLERCMKDYNEMFGTAFSLDTFDAYRKDISNRMKQDELPQIDILIVVNMMTTGFDSKPLNTLYLDKNLQWHSLVQTYSRTNRVAGESKQFGQIVSYRNIKKWQDDAFRLFSGDGDPNAYLLECYEYYVNKWVNQVPLLKRLVPTAEDAGYLQSEDEIRLFVIAFRNLVGTLATLKTFSKFDWADLAVVMDEDEYEAYKSWYLTFARQSIEKHPKIPVPVDVDFAVELVRTDKINVVYILNLMKNAAKKKERTEEEKSADVDLIIRELERSDNESVIAKRDVIEGFIRTRFYELSEEADVEQAFNDYLKEAEQAEIEEYAYANELKDETVRDIYADYVFTGTISDESIRQRLAEYHFGLLKITAVTESIKEFVEHMHKKYKAEGI